MVLAAFAASAAPAAAATDAKDDIADAPAHSGTVHYLDYDTDGATEESGEATHVPGTSRSVWLKWTPVKSGGMVISGCNSKPLGTHVRIYKQKTAGVDSVTNLLSVPAAEQRAFSCDGAEQTIAAKALQTYYIVVVRSTQFFTPDPGGGFFVSQKTDAPVVTFPGAQKAYGKSATIEFASAPKAKTYACTLDGVAKDCADGTFSAVFGKTKEHELVVTGTDDHGNVGAPATWKFTSDVTPPDTFIDSAPPTSGAPAALKFHASPDAGVTFTCHYDAIVKNPCTSGWQTPPAGPGPHKITVTAKDAFGNVDQSPAVQSFTVAPPVQPIAPQQPAQPQKPGEPQPAEPAQPQAPQPSQPQPEQPQQPNQAQQPQPMAQTQSTPPCRVVSARGRVTRRGVKVRVTGDPSRTCTVTLALVKGRRVLARSERRVAPGKRLKLAVRPRRALKSTRNVKLVIGSR